MRIGFLGDSITFGAGLAHREEERFSHLIALRLGIEDNNLGIAGTLVAKAGSSRFDGNSFVDRVEQLRGVDLAVIFGGTNDYFWTDCDIESPQKDSSDLQYFKNALEHLIEQASKFVPREKLLFITPYPHHGIGNFLGGKDCKASSEHDTTLPNYVNHTLDDYCDVIINVCNAKQVSVLDLRLAKPPFQWREMTLDGCHPNADGHRWLAEQIGDKLHLMTEK